MGPMAVWIGMFADGSVRGIIYAIRLKNKKMAESSGNRLKKNNSEKNNILVERLQNWNVVLFLTQSGKFRKKNCIIPSFMVGFKTVIVIILNKSEGDRYDKYSKSSSDRMWICRSIYGVQPGAERIVFQSWF